NSLLVSDEEIIQCFKTIRDQVIFTNKRVLVVNVQGVTGKKVAYFSYPYSKVQYFGVETAGLLDIDSELILAFNDGNRLQFDFKAQVDIARICSIISSFVL
ncbi:MAG TPA: PH domain-containing protein, partial [Clostridiales bacterium]|nr:PH domain-containing protein [Clostridiales bacterium]